MKRLLIAGAVVAALVIGGGSNRAQAQVERDVRGDVDTEIRDPVVEIYQRQPWELPGLVFPPLDEEAIVAVSEDDDQLTFITGGELGAFRPAPAGGSVFFGAGLPIFGMAAPEVLPSRVLRPLGSGDTGDRFLGTRPPIDPSTVIPKLSETFDQRRESFAFLDGIPPIVERADGSNQFPLLDQVAADTTPGVRDNIPRPDEREPEPEPGLGPTPGTAPPGTTTTAPPDEEPEPTTTSSTPRSSSTTTSTSSTTTTSTSTTTSTTTSTSTTTTSTTTTTTTTTIPDEDDVPVITTALVMGNQREEAATCLSNGAGSVSNTNTCDRLFDISEAQPGDDFIVDLTLYNVDPQSNTDAELRVFSEAGCMNGTTPGPLGTDPNLCGALLVTIQRYSDAARTQPTRCIYGGGTSTVCAHRDDRNLEHFTATHTSMTDGASIDGNFVVSEKAYLTISVRFRDRGFTSGGTGRDNALMGRTAAMAFTWRMDGT